MLFHYGVFAVLPFLVCRDAAEILVLPRKTQTRKSWTRGKSKERRGNTEPTEDQSEDRLPGKTPGQNPTSALTTATGLANRMSPSQEPQRNTRETEQVYPVKDTPDMRLKTKNAHTALAAIPRPEMKTCGLRRKALTGTKTQGKQQNKGLPSKTLAT